MSRPTLQLEAHRFTSMSALAREVEALLESSDYRLEVLVSPNQMEHLENELESCRTFGRVSLRGVKAPIATIGKPAVVVYPDGREVCSKTAAGKREYARRRDQMWERDQGICCVCQDFCPQKQATFEHKRSRGNGGCYRDDRIEKNGISHLACNSAKGSKSL